MKKILGGLLFVAILAVPAVAAAQVNLDPSTGATFGLGSADLQSTVINIVQWLLGFLGLIAVIVILYGGFVWMTAGGNEERITKAKQIITAAVVGLIVVLLAWAIVIFVVNQTSEVTT